jgi:hypothetical protein
MTRTASVNLVAAGAATLLLAAGAARSQEAPPDPAAAWAEMQKCGALVNDGARHACADDVLRRFGALAPPEARAAEHRRQFGLELPKRQPVSPAARQDHPRAAPQLASTKTAAPDSDHEISVTLGEVVLRGDGKLTLTTTDGAVWRQTESDPVRPTPKSGQTMVIERTALGGFMCKIGRWTAFRCMRRP